jgi:hypothetical protein
LHSGSHLVTVRFSPEARFPAVTLANGARHGVRRLAEGAGPVGSVGEAVNGWAAPKRTNGYQARRQSAWLGGEASGCFVGEHARQVGSVSTVGRAVEAGRPSPVEVPASARQTMRSRAEGCLSRSEGTVPDVNPRRDVGHRGSGQSAWCSEARLTRYSNHSSAVGLSLLLYFVVAPGRRSFLRSSGAWH